MAKKKTGRSSAVTRAASGRRSTGRTKAVSAGPRPSGHELVPVVCSECFEELCFDTGVKTDSLTCPVCEHTASRPDDALLHRISGHRRTERTNFMICLVVLLAGALGFARWGQVIGNAAVESGAFWSGAGLGLVAALALMGLIVKYEGNRWEVYF